MVNSLRTRLERLERRSTKPNSPVLVADLVRVLGEQLASIGSDGLDPESRAANEILKLAATAPDRDVSHLSTGALTLLQTLLQARCAQFETKPGAS